MSWKHNTLSSIALLSNIRRNPIADRIISGQFTNPLIEFQRQNFAALDTLGVPILSVQRIMRDPSSAYNFFISTLTNALDVATQIPHLSDLQTLEEQHETFVSGEKHIYTCIIDTLQVGISMHYARQVAHGAGVHLLNSIRQDNRQVTTRSLMALFGTLLGLKLKPEEKFEQFSRRLDLLIQRLHNWRPPVRLPEQLLLFCALRALPDVPYGPVRHIILASPTISFPVGMNMLRDVANSGSELISDTLGSGDVAHKSVLCITDCPAPSPKPARRRQRHGPTAACLKEGPCIHHGPKSLHATSECRNPKPKRDKKRNKKTPVQAAVAEVSEPAAAETSDVFYSPAFMVRSDIRLP